MKWKLMAVIFNDNGTIRWPIGIKFNLMAEPGATFEVHELDRAEGEESNHTLFGQPMAVGSSIREAMDNFLAIETDLINKL